MWPQETVYYQNCSELLFYITMALGLFMLLVVLRHECKVGKQRPNSNHFSINVCINNPLKNGFKILFYFNRLKAEIKAWAEEIKASMKKIC